jgi:sulfotransferase
LRRAVVTARRMSLADDHASYRSVAAACAALTDPDHQLGLGHKLGAPRNRFHFISGLPRSGSTLLSAILRQNPRFSAGISSALCALFTTTMNTMAGPGSGLISDARRANLLRGLFDSWAADLPEGTVVFDTNRYWTGRLPALLHLYPQAKVICMVRNVAAVMDSIERMLRENPLLPTRIFSDDERTNIYTRTESLAQQNRLVGGPWTCLREAFYGPDASALLVIDYDTLAREPAKVIELIYTFLGEKPFAHDFEHIEYDEPDFDEELRLPGLHRVKAKVEFTPRVSSLPQDLYDRYSALNFWTGPTPSRANFISVGAAASNFLSYGVTAPQDASQTSNSPHLATARTTGGQA